MLENLESAGGLVFSQAVLLALVESGVERDAAYRIVQQSAATASSTGIHLSQAVAAHPEVGLDPGRLEECFDLDPIVAAAGVVIDRLAAV
jgi:adenylosuccinate lyase